MKFHEILHKDPPTRNDFHGSPRRPRLASMEPHGRCVSRSVEVPYVRNLFWESVELEVACFWGLFELHGARFGVWAIFGGP